MITEETFYRCRPDFRKLEAFGFQREKGTLRYGELLPDGQFRAELEVTAEGEVRGKVIDQDTGEEYLPIRIEGQIGGFVGKVREMYLAFLEHIKEECFIPVSFIFSQSNRIEAGIHREYDVLAEFPWEKYPGNGTFKCNENGKWFAAILTVDFGKLGIPGEHDEDETVEVVNLKADSVEIPELIKQPGVCPAWHMNKKHWISVILDDTLSDDEVFGFIRKSHDLVAGSKAAKVRGTGAWMIPSNPAIYDVDAGFRAGGGEIEWHQHNNINAGDEVYIYSSAPYSALMYRCEVVAADLMYHGMFKESKGYEKSMRIRLIEKFPPDKFPLSFIKAHGGSVVRSARTMPEELIKAVHAEL